jgi:hypothetical protein
MRLLAIMAVAAGIVLSGAWGDDESGTWQRPAD